MYFEKYNTKTEKKQEHFAKEENRARELYRTRIAKRGTIKKQYENREKKKESERIVYSKAKEGSEIFTPTKICALLYKMQILCNWGNGNLSRETAFAMPVPFLLAFCNIPYTLRSYLRNNPPATNYSLDSCICNGRAYLFAYTFLIFRFNFTFLFL